MPKIRVPATTGNLGPGFDTMGMAVQLYNYISFELIPAGLEIEVVGEGCDFISRGEDNQVIQAANKVFQKVNYRPSGLKIVLENNIPIARGLGSSAAVIVGGIYLANIISGEHLNPDEILNLAVEIEGHPDNVAAALFGGVTVAVSEKMERQTRVDYLKIEPPKDLQTVVAIPEFQLSTQDARISLPEMVTREDAVFNIGHSTLMISALMQDNLNLFGKMMKDKIHQPYRENLIPGMVDVFQRAQENGALSVAVSGAGPTLISFILAGGGNQVAKGMLEAFASKGIKAKALVLNPDNTGVQII